MRPTLWLDCADIWVRQAPEELRMRIAVEVATKYDATDENEGDRTETRESVAWLRTAGHEGRPWGRPAKPAFESQPDWWRRCVTSMVEMAPPDAIVWTGLSRRELDEAAAAGKVREWRSGYAIRWRVSDLRALAEDRLRVE